MKYLEYKNYTGSIEYSREDDLLFGKVLGIQSLISYEGKTGHELENDFKLAIDAFLESCRKEEIKPEKPFKGSFNVRISPELHHKAALLAMKEKITLNNLVAESIREKILRETDFQHQKDLF